MLYGVRARPDTRMAAARGRHMHGVGVEASSHPFSRGVCACCSPADTDATGDAVTWLCCTLDGAMVAMSAPSVGMSTRMVVTVGVPRNTNEIWLMEMGSLGACAFDTVLSKSKLTWCERARTVRVCMHAQTVVCSRKCNRFEWCMRMHAAYMSAAHMRPLRLDVAEMPSSRPEPRPVNLSSARLGVKKSFPVPAGSGGGRGEGAGGGREVSNTACTWTWITDPFLEPRAGSQKVKCSKLKRHVGARPASAGEPGSRRARSHATGRAGHALAYAAHHPRSNPRGRLRVSSSPSKCLSAAGGPWRLSCCCSSTAEAT